jgi:hypothetical protein
MISLAKQHHSVLSRYASRLIAVGIAWGLLLALLAAIMDSTPETAALAASIWSAALYTLGLRATRRWWLSCLSGQALRNAVILSIFNACVIEIEFLVFEKIFHAEGIAASPNWIVDLILMVPWYALMALSFVRVQNIWRFSTAAVLFLGAIYELGADGIVGPLMGMFFGSRQLFTLQYWLLMFSSAFWGFISVYSSLVLPPAWLVATTEPPGQSPAPAWRAALKPLLWLLPYALYLLLMMVVLSAIPF